MLNKLMSKINNLEETMFDDNFDYEKEISECGILLVKNYDILSSFNIAMIGIFFVDFKNDKNFVPMIVVDGDFMELSDMTKRFLIGHELGHYEKHMNKIIKPGYIRNLNDEFEADENGAEMVGLENAIEALEELKDKLNEISFGTNLEGIAEVDLRIENLVNKLMVTC